MQIGHKQHTTPFSPKALSAECIFTGLHEARVVAFCTCVWNTELVWRGAESAAASLAGGWLGCPISVMRSLDHACEMFSDSSWLYVYVGYLICFMYHATAVCLTGILMRRVYGWHGVCLLMPGPFSKGQSGN